MVVFNLVGKLRPDIAIVISLFVCSWWLTVYCCYHVYFSSNNQKQACTKVGGTGCLPLGQCTSRDRQLFQAYHIHVYFV